VPWSICSIFQFSDEKGEETVKRLVLIFIVVVLSFLCLMSLGPAILKSNMHEGTPLSIGAGVFGFLFLFVAVMYLLCSALDKAEEPERREVQQQGEELRIKAMEKEIEAYRIWAKRGKMPVKISPKGDTKR